MWIENRFESWNFHRIVRNCCQRKNSKLNRKLFMGSKTIYLYHLILRFAHNYNMKPPIKCASNRACTKYSAKPNSPAIENEKNKNNKCPVRSEESATTVKRKSVKLQNITTNITWVSVPPERKEEINLMYFRRFMIFLLFRPLSNTIFGRLM